MMEPLAPGVLCAPDCELLGSGMRTQVPAQAQLPSHQLATAGRASRNIPVNVDFNANICYKLMWQLLFFILVNSPIVIQRDQDLLKALLQYLASQMIYFNPLN